MRPLALHQLTALEAGPVGLVSIAAEVGCEQVCLFVHSPRAGSDRAPAADAFPTVTRELKGELKARLDGCGISVSNVDFFPLGRDTVVDDHRAALELAAELGARRAVAIVNDTVEERAVANLVRLSELAAEVGLAVGLEFMGLSPGCTSLRRALQLIQRVGRPNVGLAVDPLHLVRTGGTVAELAGVPPGLIAHAQLCDGAHARVTSSYLGEAMDRLAPGDGVFPLRELVRALPETTPIDVEVPSLVLRRQGVPARERARRAVAAARRLLEAIDASGSGAVEDHGAARQSDEGGVP